MVAQTRNTDKTEGKKTIGLIIDGIKKSNNAKKEESKKKRKEE